MILSIFLLTVSELLGYLLDIPFCLSGKGFLGSPAVPFNLENVSLNLSFFFRLSLESRVSSGLSTRSLFARVLTFLSLVSRCPVTSSLSWLVVLMLVL